MSVRKDEGGWALVSALMLMTVMMMSGLALASMTDVQSTQSSAQRQRETAFNLAEAAMNAQVFALARDWPGKGQSLAQYPNCAPGVASTRCPSNDALLASIPSADAAGATWSTTVKDNGPTSSQSFYSDSAISSQPGYDANGDGNVWVRASATARGRTRTIVALVRAQLQSEELPHAALISGRLDISNNGNKIIIDASGGAGPVAVRCTPQLIDVTPCIGHLFGIGRYKNLTDLLSYLTTQIAGTTPVTGFTGGAAMSAEARARLKARAIADGTYYTGCPSSLAGAIVYIEAGNCSYTGNSVYNSAQAPGLVLMNTGTLYIGGTVNYYGVLYHANGAAVTGSAVQVQGNASIVGGILVDGGATVVAGSSKVNIQLDLNAYDAISSYGSAGVLQNTWRELGT